jgi:hypothetical protein
MNRRKELVIVLVLGNTLSLADDAPTIPAQTEETTTGARLLNLDSSIRIPGRYFVRFKSEDKLSTIARSGSGAPTILPHVLPTSDESVRVLALALAESVVGVVRRVLSGKMKAFVIDEVSKDAIKRLAKDPRIEFIEPVMKSELTATPPLATPNV